MNSPWRIHANYPGDFLVLHRPGNSFQDYLFYHLPSEKHSLEMLSICYFCNPKLVSSCSEGSETHLNYTNHMRKKAIHSNFQQHYQSAANIFAYFRLLISSQRKKILLEINTS